MSKPEGYMSTWEEARAAGKETYPWRTPGYKPEWVSLENCKAEIVNDHGEGIDARSGENMTTMKVSLKSVSPLLTHRFGIKVNTGLAKWPPKGSLLEKHWPWPGVDESTLRYYDQVVSSESESFRNEYEVRCQEIRTGLPLREAREYLKDPQAWKQNANTHKHMKG